MVPWNRGVYYLYRSLLGMTIFRIRLNQMYVFDVVRDRVYIATHSSSFWCLSLVFKVPAKNFLFSPQIVYILSL